MQGLSIGGDHVDPETGLSQSVCHADCRVQPLDIGDVIQAELDLVGAHDQRSGIRLTQSGSKIAFWGGNSRPPLIQMNAEFCPRVSVVIARRPNPVNNWE